MGEGRFRRDLTKHSRAKNVIKKCNDSVCALKLSDWKMHQEKKNENVKSILTWDTLQ